MGPSAGKFEALLEPLRIGDITIKNRITMSSLTRNRAICTYPTDLMKKYYLERVKGDVGLIVTESILVSRQGTEWPLAPGLWDDIHVACWRAIVDDVHAAGGHIYAQLWHAGRMAHPDESQQRRAGTPVYAPSAISARGGKFRRIPGMPGYVTPTAVPDPRIIVAEFKRAAINAKKAGFDGVELQGANGYLVTQFLDISANQRKDEWGGSVENRCRFGLEVLKELISVFGRNVALKLSPAGGYNDAGMPFDDTLATYSYFISEADKLGLAYFALVRYSAKLDMEFDGKSRATEHDVVATFRPFVKNAKVIVNCDVTVEEGEKLIGEGQVDAIAIGYNYIAHPDLAKHVANGCPLNNT